MRAQSSLAGKGGQTLLWCRGAALCFPRELLAPYPVQSCQHGISTSAPSCRNWVQGLEHPQLPPSSILGVSPEFRGWLYPALLLYQPHSRVRVLLRDTQPCPCSLVMLKSEEDKVEQQGRAWGFQPAPCLPRRDQLPLVNLRYQRGSNSQIL